MIPALAAALAVLAAASDAAAAAPDGAKLFAQRCASCHGAASTAAGPTLRGAFGADIAGRADFKYSPALQRAAGAWDEPTLDRYLAAPAKFAPGGRMFIAVPKAEERAAVVAYIKTLK